MSKKFFITTPAYYANNIAHVGHAYTTIAADILARYHKQKGEEVFFLSGQDEHGQHIQEIAEAKNVKPQAYVDRISNQFKKVFKLLDIDYSNFIRTTDPKHEKEVKKILQELYDKKFIYKGEYESLYCIGCEQYLTQRDLVDGKCPLHKKEPELRKEEAYLFKLSSFQKKLLGLIKTNKFCILPEDRRKEVISFIEGGLQDISVSRRKEKVHWGIELPFDKNHTCFVWVDAFWFYLTGLKTKENFTKFWPPDVQLMAKDIIRVHSTIWPALLLALKIKLPKQLFVHGYFTVDGQKMSKTVGNVIDPVEIVNKYGADALRYILLRDIPFGDDGDFSEKALVERYNGELANELGNLVSRALTLIETSGLKSGKFELKQELDKVIKAVSADFEKLEINRAVEHVWDFIRAANKYIQDKKPWTKPKGIDDIIFTLAQSLRAISVLVWPFLPDSAEKIAKQLGIKVGRLASIDKKVKFKVKKGDILFPKLEFKDVEVEFSDKKVIVDKEILSKMNRGEVSVAFAELVDLNVQTKSSKLEKLKKELKLDEAKLRKVIEGYRYLVSEGRDKHNALLSSENLLQLYEKKLLPNINTLTDAYNLVSLKTGLIMGIYDEKAIRGDVILKVADGSEQFVPIGEKDQVKIRKGEYLVCDSANWVLTKWITKQGNQVAVARSTRRAILCVQGNKNVSQEEVNKGLKEVCELVTQVCGGKYRVVPVK